MSETIAKTTSNEDLKNRQREYWRNKNLQADARNYLLELLRRQDGGLAPEWKQEQLTINAPTAKELLKVCNNSDISLYILLVTLFKGVAFKYSGEPLVTVVSPLYQAEPGSTVRDYVLLQDKVMAFGDVRENVQETKKTVIGAYSNQAYFEEVAGRDNVLCMLDNMHPAGALLDKFVLSVKFRRENEVISGAVLYDAAGLESDLVKKFAAQFSHFIEQACQNFRQRVDDVELLVELDCVRGDVTGIPELKLHQLFEEQAARTPLATALIFNDAQITYRDLDEMADKAAANLVSRGVKPGDRVVLQFNRGVEMIVAVLGVLKTGAAFVPVSPDEPEERLNYILKETAPRLLLKNVQYSDDKFDVEFDNRTPAYIIFTSGTTGVPKGVVVEHRAIVNANIWRKKVYDLSVELLLFAYNFDGFILNLFTPLISGATVVLIDDAKDPKAIAECIVKNKVTHFTAVPALYQAILEQSTKEQLASLKSVTLAGDVAERKTILLSNVAMSNEYGPTENAVVSTFHQQLEPGSAKVIGKPIDNVNAYILNAKQNPVPVGIFGELYLGGAGVAREYLNNPELTAKAFISYKGDRLYRTGDAARWLPDGNIEFKGRIDQQIKLRGFRIELEEIRSCILINNAVQDAAVVMLGENADAGLYACVTLKQHISMDDLTAHVSSRLPHYMVPQQFIALPNIALTESGKHDLTAIKAAIKQHNEKSEKEVPLNEVEQKLVKLWKDILKLQQVGVNQNFFSLGGHSLKATSLLFEIHKTFKVDLPLKQIFITNTIRELAKVIENLKGSRTESIPIIPKQDHYALSSAQERLFVLDSAENVGMSYNIPIAFELEGNLDVKRLEYALNALVQRHESLRTSFAYVNDQAVQVVNENCTITINEEDFAGDFALSAFNLEKGPLFRVNLYRVNEARRYLVFDFHHIIIDETSLTVFFDELVKLYNKDNLKELAISYKDYAAWQRQRLQSEEYKKKLAYWVSKLSSRDLQPLNLPYDYTRANKLTYKGGRLGTPISPEMFEAIQLLCKNNESTNFIFFLAAFTVLLNKYTGQKEIIVGSPVSEREHPGTRDVVGLFLNTIPLLNMVHNDQSFLDHLRSVRSNVITDISNSEAQFDDIVKAIKLERELDKNPLFNVMLAIIDNDVTKLQLESIKAESIAINNNTSKFDFMLEVHTSESGIMLYYEYSARLFSEATVNRIARSFQILLENIVRKPETNLSELQILDDADRSHLLQLAAGKYDNTTSDETTISVFEKQAAARPNATALVLGQQTLSYDELNKKANQLAREVQKLITPGEIVAILCGRSFAGIINILAVQKAGGAYMPLDITYPKERINTILANSGVKLLLTDQDDLSAIKFNNTILRTNELDVSANAGTNLEPACHPDYVCYVLYTSGTTGVPKGVMVGQRNTVNLIKKTTPYFPLSSQDVFTMFHSYCFDVSVWEMYASLLNGAKLVIVPTPVAQDPKEMLDLIVKNGVTILCQPPSAFYMLSEEMKSSPVQTNLRCVILGGEAVRMYKLKNWYKHYPGVRLVNGYGITETTVYSTYKEIGEYEIDHNIGSIGAPIPTNYMYILDERMQPCPVGVLGEIYIGGLCVGKGYLNNKELTAKKILPDPFNPGQLMYRSGDLARWLPNGEIVYSSRLDHQVKVRGFRVEIAEIETVLAQYETIKDVVVIGLDDEETGTQLVAYFTASQKEDTAQVRTFLGRYLSHYMIPAYIIQIDQVPLSTNGKVDRSRLPNPKTMHNKETIKRAATTPQEKLLVDIWADILGLQPEQISIDDNFFTIGGDSISASLVVRRLNNFNIQARIVDVFESKTIAGLCQTIAAKQAPGQSAELENYWKEAAAKETEPLPRLKNASENHVQRSLSIELPVKSLRAIVDNAANNIQLPEILLTALGMSFRMWTAGERFRVVFQQGAHSSMVILEIDDINLCKENLEAASRNLQQALKYKVAKKVLNDDVLFQYNSTSGSPTDALCISTDGVKLEANFNGEVYSEKSIKLVLENFKFCLRQVIDHFTQIAEQPSHEDEVMHAVEPFNEVFYRDCTYQALIPAIHYFGRNFQLLFANSNSIYEVDESSKNVRFRSSYVVDKSDQELFQALGIKVNKFYDSHDICEDLMNNLSQGALAIVKVDCYYIERKKELYLKKHGAHSVLVYGYDKKKQVFNIIDNQSIIGVNYQKNLMSFEELKTAYAGYIEHFNLLHDQVTLYTVSKKDAGEPPDYDKDAIRTITLHNLDKLKQKLPENRSALDHLYNNFADLISDEETLLTNVAQLNHVVGEIVNAKKIEQYKAAHILQHEAMTQVLNGIVEHLEDIRNVLTKIEMSQTYRSGSANRMLDKLKEIVNLETNYVSQIEELKLQD